ncbi:hypothetical protein [Larkinella terrae]|uniref:Uncharacterized protein n=1 Tax=Larkinella terrae TaxID=2025311 RepID=A0A7K0EIZ8_9BACT|nr:hypothetical protein [Larkinella terrae]MRS61764.1 hypothetical protein [Larkinella terrae]
MYLSIHKNGNSQGINNVKTIQHENSVLTIVMQPGNSIPDLSAFGTVLYSNGEGVQISAGEVSVRVDV